MVTRRSQSYSHNLSQSPFVICVRVRSSHPRDAEDIPFQFKFQHLSRHFKSGFLKFTHCWPSDWADSESGAKPNAAATARLGSGTTRRIMEKNGLRFWLKFFFHRPKLADPKRGFRLVDALWIFNSTFGTFGLDFLRVFVRLWITSRHPVCPFAINLAEKKTTRTAQKYILYSEKLFEVKWTGTSLGNEVRKKEEIFHNGQLVWQVGAKVDVSECQATNGDGKEGKKKLNVFPSG